MCVRRIRCSTVHVYVFIYVCMHVFVCVRVRAFVVLREAHTHTIQIVVKWMLVPSCESWTELDPLALVARVVLFSFSLVLVRKPHSSCS